MYELKHECPSTSVLITRTLTSTDILFCDKTPVPMFYFDSKKARPIVPLKCAALVFWKAYIDRMLFSYADCKSNTHGPRARTHILTDK